MHTFVNILILTLRNVTRFKKFLELFWNKTGIEFLGSYTKIEASTYIKSSWKAWFQNFAPQLFISLCNRRFHWAHFLTKNKTTKLFYNNNKYFLPFCLKVSVLFIIYYIIISVLFIMHLLSIIKSPYFMY